MWIQTYWAALKIARRLKHFRAQQRIRAARFESRNKTTKSLHPSYIYLYTLVRGCCFWEYCCVKSYCVEEVNRFLGVTSSAQKKEVVDARLHSLSLLSVARWFRPLDTKLVKMRLNKNSLRKGELPTITVTEISVMLQITSFWDQKWFGFKNSRHSAYFISERKNLSESWHSRVVGAHSSTEALQNTCSSTEKKKIVVNGTSNYQM